MHELLDHLREAVARVSSSDVVSRLVDACRDAGANAEQIIGACAAGLAMRPKSESAQ